MRTLSYLISCMFLYITIFVISNIWNIQSYILSLATVILGVLILYYTIEYLTEKRYQVQLKK